MTASTPALSATASHQPDPSCRGLYRVGGWSGMAIVAPYLAAIVLISVAPPPLTARGAETLEYVAAHRWLYIVEQVLWVAPSVLAMVVFLALTAALWRLDNSFAAVAGLIGTTAWATTLALPTSGGGALTLVSLADQYAAATAAEQRAAFATAAEGYLAENNTPSAVGV